MEIVVFTLNAIVIYFVADWIVRLLERHRGRPLRQRQVVFFGVFLILILVSFQILKRLFAGG